MKKQSLNSGIKDVLARHRVKPGVFKAGTGPPGTLSGIVRGQVAQPLWADLARIYSDTGLWPIIRGDANEELMLPISGKWPRKTAVARGPAQQILTGTLNEYRKMYSEWVPTIRPNDDLLTIARKADSADDSTPKRWPKKPKQVASQLLAPWNLTTLRFVPRVSVWLVPVRNSWEVPAALGFGDWNECPSGKIISGVLRDWHRRYGANIACLTNDSMECMVDRPPQTEKEATQLACEQWLLCEDIVSQGTESVRGLALGLWRSPVWFFWWD